ncbi:MAG: MotA/TolQ/ExbB proton channel family protein [Pseudobacteriovorax sp.]|nr:MotA/TolQ/ExbB proton channel family protein [Pseudobacteriovorax sp.]
MEGPKLQSYLKSTQKRFDPISLLLSLTGLAAVVYSIGFKQDVSHYFDVRSILVVICGTFASILFQFDIKTCFLSVGHLFQSFLGTPNRNLVKTIQLLDEAILRDMSFTELRDGNDINGEILNDMIYMHRHGLLVEEIEDFISSKISDGYLARRVTVDLLKKAAVIAPALGLFGTVIGLIGVLKSLSDPTLIGPSMSLALMTTAYGAALGSLVFTPLAGRMEHHNIIYLATYERIMTKAGVLIRREEQDGQTEFEPEVAA